MLIWVVKGPFLTSVLSFFWESFYCLGPFFHHGYIHYMLNKISHDMSEFSYLWYQPFQNDSWHQLCSSSLFNFFLFFHVPSFGVYTDLGVLWHLESEIMKQRTSGSWNDCMLQCDTSIFQSWSFIFLTGEGGCVQGKTVGCFFCIAGKVGVLLQQFFCLDDCFFCGCVVCVLWVFFS